MLIYKRIMSAALAAAMLVGMLPHGAFASETETLPQEEVAPAVTEESVMETGAPTVVTEVSATIPAETELETVPTEAVEETAAAETVAETAAPEETEPEEVYEEISEVIVPDAELPENGALYDGYLTRMFYGNSIAFFGTNARERLTEIEQKFYDVLKAEIIKIAAGERTSTRIEIKKAQLAEWGMTVSFDISDATTTQEKATIVHNGVFAQVNQRNIINALMYDCPYEMYWYDKTAGTLLSSGCSVSGTTGTVTRVMFNFRVAGDMQPDGYAANNPTIDTSFVSTAKAAAERAQSIVESNAALDDYKKLVAYKDAICDLTSYNSAVASSSVYTTDADPWQLIYVFDGDSSTTVVCEGYSKAFQYLFDLSTFRGDVSSIIVVGALNGGGHMWNVVSIDGKNYMVDVTNSDSGTAGQNGGLFLAGSSGSVSGGYRFLGHSFTYTDNTIELWGEEKLTLSDSDYVPYLASGSCGENLAWTLDNGGTLEITGSGAMESYASEEEVPWYAVRDQVREILLPGGITQIGSYAFYGCGITEITIPSGVTAIGANAFGDCTSLTVVNFLGDAPAMESGAFDGTAAAAYYSAANPTWTEDVIQGLGTEMTWTATCFDGHTEAIDGAVAPTCLETGLTEGKHCTVCGEILLAQQVLDALGHTEVIDEAVAPTCTDTGLTEGRHCSVCEEILLAQEIVDALGHTDGETVKENDVTPDCVNTGSYDNVVYCAACNFELSRETVPVDALGHTEVIDAAVTPSCTETGLTEGKHCSVCDEVLLAQEEIPATGHNFFIGVCQNCGLEIKTDYDMFSGKTMTLKLVNPETGKDYTTKELTWELVEGCEPFASISKTGRLTAKKVFEKVRIEVIGTVAATGEKTSVLVEIYPAVTQVEVKKDGETVNGKTLLMDFTQERLVLTVDVFPADTLPEITWSVSDSKRAYAEDYCIEEDGTLTVLNPKGKAGTVTLKATVNAGVKKTVTVKVQFGSYAKTVEIAEPQTTTIRSGESLLLSAAITEPETVTKPGIVWSLSDKTAATISGGRVKAKSVPHPVTVTVTATSKDGQASDTIDIHILPKDEGKLVLMNDNAFVTNTTKAMNAGDAYQISAAIITNGVPVPQNVVWTSSKNTVATVENGLITAMGAGTARISAECNGEKVSVTVKVSTLVADMEITTKDGKNLDREEEQTIVLVASGKSVNLVANILTKGAARTVTWQITEGSEYAKITASGKLTANKDLTSVQYATVRATAKDGSGTSATIRVKILPLATGVQIYQNGTRVRSNTVFVYDMLQGSNLKLNAKVFPAKANQAVELTSSNKKVAEFIDGELVCYKAGTVTITAKALDGSNQKTTFKLTVVKKVTSLSLKEGSNLTVVGGKSLKLVPMIEISPSDATNKKLTWSVAPNDYGITISSAGVLKTQKVSQPVTVNVMVIPQDGSGVMLAFDVTVNPA